MWTEYSQGYSSLFGHVNSSSHHSHSCSCSLFALPSSQPTQYGYSKEHTIHHLLLLIVLPMISKITEDFWNVLWLYSSDYDNCGLWRLLLQSHFGRFTTTIATDARYLSNILWYSYHLSRLLKLNQFQALSYEFIYKLHARDKIRHHSSIIISHIFRINLYKKRVQSAWREEVVAWKRSFIWRL